MQELDKLQLKLNQLIQAYSALQSEQASLLQKLARQEAFLQQQKKIIATQEQALQVKSVADAATNTEAQEKLKQHLDSVIQLIDQHIEKL